jgi:uncharacterized protein YecA (UPF0149 family)
MSATPRLDRPMHVMADLLRRGRHADEAMAILAAERSTVYAGARRNGPCPCGSGRRYKYCHSEVQLR